MVEQPPKGVIPRHSLAHPILNPSRNQHPIPFLNITKLVKNKTARLVHYRDGHFIYETEDGFQFPVPLADIGTATLLAEDKALFFMRWIRRQLDVKEAAKK
jgi:hypothetical protein